MNNLIKMSIVLLLAIALVTLVTTTTNASRAQLTLPNTNTLSIKPFENTTVNGQIQLIEAHTKVPNTPIVLSLTYPTNSTALFLTTTDKNGYAGIVFPVDSSQPGYVSIAGIIDNINENQTSTAYYTAPELAQFIVAP